MQIIIDIATTIGKVISGTIESFLKILRLITQVPTLIANSILWLPAPLIALIGALIGLWIIKLITNRRV